MPTKPPRRTPARSSTRPGARRESRPLAAGPGSSARTAHGDTTDQATAHAEARSRQLSAFALGVTYRVIAIVTVAAVLAISFVSSYSVYLGQQRDIAQVKAEIARHNAEIGRLNDELARWEDPAYVRAQARDRLGWVLPGEVGYRVIDADGNVIGGTVSTIDPSDSAANSVWYEALWLSIQTADRPEPSRPGSNPVNPNPAPDQDPGSTGSAEAPNGTSSGEGTDRGGFKTNRSPR